MTNDLNSKYVRQDVFEERMKNVHLKLDMMHSDIKDLKNGRKGMDWRLIVALAVLAMGSGGVGSGVFSKILEALAK